MHNSASFFSDDGRFVAGIHATAITCAMSFQERGSDEDATGTRSNRSSRSNRSNRVNPEFVQEFKGSRVLNPLHTLIRQITAVFRCSPE
jgi:hypothetical protein